MNNRPSILGHYGLKCNLLLISQINTVVLFWKAIKACTSTSRFSTSDQVRHQLLKKYASCTVLDIFF